jgi:general secretion pathway protein E
VAGNALAQLIAPPRSPDHATVWLSEALALAARLRATDVHFFPAADGARLWFRVDGSLVEVTGYPMTIHERLIARLKVLAKTPDYVREAVSEGRLSIGSHTDRLDARLSVIPAMTGEKAVVRLLHSGGSLPDLARLGFSDRLQAHLRGGAARAQGLLLVCGPAGSGKSTTLAALLADLAGSATGPTAILTLEDPPEIPMPFATQVAVQPHRELGFAQGLRALLRQDPEVILVGEIRDPETAQTALGAALTGHRLFSSLHTLNAGEALVRLQEMGAAPYLLASAVGGILSQRLVRCPCAACAVATPLAELIGEGDPMAGVIPSNGSARVARGCDECHGLGYRGRTALGQWSQVAQRAADALVARQTAEQVHDALDHPIHLSQEIVTALAAGLTTLDEARRAWVGSHARRTGESR